MEKRTAWIVFGVCAGFGLIFGLFLGPEVIAMFVDCGMDVETGLDYDCMVDPFVFPTLGAVGGFAIGVIIAVFIIFTNKWAKLEE